MILINKDTKVITQGITGKTGPTPACAVSTPRPPSWLGVNPKKAGEDPEGVPIFASVKDAKRRHRRHRVRHSMCCAPPPPSGKPSAGRTVICITEGIPVRDMLEVKNRMKARSKTLLLARPRPDHPGRNQDRHHAGPTPPQGRIGIVSRSGTLTYEAVAQVTELGLGQSSAVGIGGDPINGLKHVDVLKMFNDDPDTDAVIMIGEIGGPDEVNAACGPT